MNLDHLAQFDGMLSLLGAIGIWPVWKRLRPTETLNPLEKRLYWMLIFLLSLLVVRVPLMGFGNTLIFGAATYVAASLFSFSVFLYFEILLRRHMPLALKVFASLGTVYFVILSILGRVYGDIEQLKLFGLFYFVISLITCSIAIFRRRADYSTSENRLIDMSILGLFVLGPFFLTDIAGHQYEEIPKMGTLGALLFAYVSLYNQALFMQRGYLIGKLFKAFGFSVLSELAVYLLVPSLPIFVHFRIFLLLFVMSLIFRIWYAVKSLDGDDDFFSFVRAVTESDKINNRSFLAGMREYFGAVELKVLKPSDLPNYRIEKWSLFYQKMKTDCFSVFDLKRLLEEENNLIEERDIVEEMIDALDSFDMTHLCLLGRSHHDLIVFQVPMVGYGPMIQLKTKLVGEFSRLIDR
jgi:hypothetical protein